MSQIVESSLHDSRATLFESSTDGWEAAVLLQELLLFVCTGGGVGVSHIMCTSSPVSIQLALLDLTAVSLLSTLYLCKILTTVFTAD